MCKTDDIEQALYIQIDEPQKQALIQRKETRQMKLVKQKADPQTNSPRPRRLAQNEGQISDVSDVEPAPNTGQNMLRLNLKFENLEDVLERI